MNAENAIKVLLVEDSKLLAEQLLELLDSIPDAVSIGVVATESDAIAASIAQRPDLLILDLHLKQGTGFGVLKALSQQHNPPHVVVLTNYALPQYREQAIALGADYFLDKSCDFDRLPHLIKGLAQSAALNGQSRN